MKKIIWYRDATVTFLWLMQRFCFLIFSVSYFCHRPFGSINTMFPIVSPLNQTSQLTVNPPYVNVNNIPDSPQDKKKQLDITSFIPNLLRRHMVSLMLLRGEWREKSMVFSICAGKCFPWRHMEKTWYTISLLLIWLSIDFQYRWKS